MWCGALWNQRMLACTVSSTERTRSAPPVLEAEPAQQEQCLQVDHCRTQECQVLMQACKESRTQQTIMAKYQRHHWPIISTHHRSRAYNLRHARELARRWSAALHNTTVDYRTPISLMEVDVKKLFVPNLRTMKTPGAYSRFRL